MILKPKSVELPTLDNILQFANSREGSIEANQIKEMEQLLSQFFLF